jgi:exoribonuclease R
MVLANVAAAEELQRLKQPLLFRVHEEPSPEKLDALREVAEASGFTGQGAGAEDRASEPAAGAGRGHRI